MSYNCDNCNYLTKYSSNYKKHLKTNKHLNNQAEGELSSKIDEVENAKEGTKNIQKHPKTSKHIPNCPKNAPKHPKKMPKYLKTS